MSCILDLSDGLLVMICQYALCPTHGLLFKSIYSRFRKCNDRCENWNSIAAGLFFTNRRLSRIAIPILYGENTFSFISELREIMKFFRSLPPKNLKQIKRIYIPDQLRPYTKDSPSLPFATTFLSQRMSLKSFSIAVPQYVGSNNGKLSSTALRMLQDGRLKEVRFVHERPVYPCLWEGEAGVFGDEIVEDFVEYILLDKETREDLQKRRRSCTKRTCGIPAGKYDEEQLEKTRAEYRDMLIGIKSVWEGAGVTVERERSYLNTERSAVVIRLCEKRGS